MTSFIESSKDSQGRKNFWLPYASSVIRTRVVVCPQDEARLGKKLSKLNISNHVFAELIGSSSSSNGSAFLMDFGKYIVVEFSRENNSCYIYKKNNNHSIESKFWDKKFFIDDLKNTRKNDGRWSHISFWEKDFANKLALIDIRSKK